MVGDDFSDVGLNAVPEDPPVRLRLRSRAQAHPAHYAILAEKRDLDREIGQVAGGRLLSLEHCRKIFGENLRHQHVAVGDGLVNSKPGDPFEAGAEVEKSRSFVLIELILKDCAVGQAIAYGAQLRFALTQPFLVCDAFRDVRPNAVPNDLSLRLPFGARTQPHPTRFAIFAANGDLDSGIGQVAGGGLLSLQQLRQIFRQDLRVQRTHVRHCLLHRNAGEPFNTPADIEESRISCRVVLVAKENAIGQVIAHGAQLRLALARFFLFDYTFCNVFGVNDDAADVPPRTAPWQDFPLQPLSRAVSAQEQLPVSG